MRLLAPISYFESTPRSTIWSLDTDTGVRRRIFEQSPPTQLAVRGKGITGLDWLDHHHLIACDFNQVLCIRRGTGEISASLHNPLYNDLHSVIAIPDHIGVCNTGLDAIEWLNRDLTPRRRQLLITHRASRNRVAGRYRQRGDYYDSPTNIAGFTRRKVPDRFHLNHLVWCAGHWLGTAFRRRALVDIRTGRRASNVLPHWPHDGLLHRNRLWVTTVAGELFSARPRLPLEFTRCLSLFDSAPYQGWCRGLLFDGPRAFIAITQVMQDSSRTAWLNVPALKTRSGIYQVHIDSGRIEDFHDFTVPDGARLFTLLADH